MYHRVAVAAVDPWGLCVAPDRFAEQLRTLREHADVVPLEQLRQCLRSGRRSRPAVAITFDDGYADNLDTAKPMLEQYGAPATVFLATDYIGRRGPFWWDDLAGTILGRHRLPPRIRLEAGARTFAWQDDRLGLTGRRGDVARRRVHDRLWGWLAGLTDPDRRLALDRLHEWAQVTAQGEVEARPLLEDEVRELIVGGLVDVGAHAASHRMLSTLTATEKTDEISRSWHACRRLVGRHPKCFAYPHGDYDAEAIAAVRDCGFAVACTSRQDLVWSSTDPYLLPRVVVGNWTGQALLTRLEWNWLA